jgi:hypothetical protein
MLISTPVRNVTEFFTAGDWITLVVVVVFVIFATDLVTGALLKVFDLVSALVTGWTNSDDCSGSDVKHVRPERDRVQ